jgi:hypothetical protein
MWPKRAAGYPVIKSRQNTTVHFLVLVLGLYWYWDYIGTGVTLVLGLYWYWGYIGTGAIPTDCCKEYEPHTANKLGKVPIAQQY